MQISEADLRQMVRDAIDRHRAQAEAMPGGSTGEMHDGSTGEAWRRHASHGVLPLMSGKLRRVNQTSLDRLAAELAPPA